jgi:2-polyprenyl-6-methoxyphenol hydroxylase-like FAD-dependent oxidoreductase
VARPRALVIGGSVGGLFAAHLLRATGFDVLVCERVAGDLGDRGAGIGTREELFSVMRRIGLPAETLHGVAVRGRIGLAADGGVIHGAPVPAVTSAWSRIGRPLRRALPDDCYAAGQKLTRLEQAGDQVTAEFADGMRDAADLLVAADGLHSTVRQQLLPEIEPRYAGYVAWRGVVRERNAAPAVRDLLFEHMLFGCPDGELMLSIPMPGTAEAADERCCHFVWFRPVDQDTLADLCTDAAGRRHGLSIPPPLIREELLAGLRRDAQALLAPQLASLVSATEQIILQPIFDLESPRMAFGRVALLGDAVRRPSPCGIRRDESRHRRRNPRECAGGQPGRSGSAAALQRGAPALWHVAGGAGPPYRRARHRAWPRCSGADRGAGAPVWFGRRGGT